jgi:hypothetical protein
MPCVAGWRDRDEICVRARVPTCSLPISTSTTMPRRPRDSSRTPAGRLCSSLARRDRYSGQQRRPSRPRSTRTFPIRLCWHMRQRKVRFRTSQPDWRNCWRRKVSVPTHGINDGAAGPHVRQSRLGEITHRVNVDLESKLPFLVRYVRLTSTVIDRS